MAIDKKSALASLTRLYLQVEADGTVKALGTDIEHYAEIRSNSAYNTSAGVLGIDTEDMKVIAKMNGEIWQLDIIGKNRIRKNENKDIARLCEYALRRCLDANTNLLVLGTTGVSYEDARAQVAQIIKEETAYKKVMGESFYSKK